MNPELGIAGMPGLGPKVTANTRIFLKNDAHFFKRGVVIEKNAVDTGNTGETTTLRPGLVLVRIEAGANKGKWTTFGAAGAPAVAAAVKCGLLMEYQHMKGKDGAVEDKGGSVLVHGWVDNAQVIYEGAPLALDADKATVRALMKLIDFEIAVP